MKLLTHLYRQERGEENQKRGNGPLGGEIISEETSRGGESVGVSAGGQSMDH